MSEERRCLWQVAFGLRNRRLFHQGIDVARHDIQPAIQLSERVGETTKHDIELGLSGNKTHVARVQSLGFVEVGLATLPLPLISCEEGK